MTQEVFLDCQKAMEYLVSAERNTVNFAAIETSPHTKPINHVAIIGAGTMGAGIAMCCASTGIKTTLIDLTQDGLNKGLHAIRTNYERQVQRGRINEAMKLAAMTLINGELSVSAASDADLIIEAAFEDIGVKKDIFRALDELGKDGVILATNTSTFDINEIAHVTARPQDVIGLHFFSPANVMPLLEVVRTDSTSADVIHASMLFAQRIRKTPVLAKVCYGFIGNRMMEGYAREAERMVLEGASPRRVDAALKGFGMAMGMLTVMDMAGLDVGVNVRKANAHRLPKDPTYYQASQALFDAGRLGQKNGKGYYQYKPGDRQPYDDEEALEIIRKRAELLGVKQRSDHTEQEIVERCISPLLNEALEILDEGIAEKASDIDVVWTLGYGFPKGRGGPIYYATHGLGLSALHESILKYQKIFGDVHWRSARLLGELLEKGLGVSDWELQRAQV